MTQTLTTRGATTSGATGSATGRRRAANIGLWVLQVVTAAMFVMGGASKVTSNPQAVAGFDAIGFGDWFRYLIGALELAGAVALLIPVLSGLAGLAFVGLMIGAVITQATVFDGEMVAFPAAVLVLVAVIAWGRRRRTAQLVRLVRGVRTAGPR